MSIVIGNTVRFKANREYIRNIHRNSGLGWNDEMGRIIERVNGCSMKVKRVGVNLIEVEERILNGFTWHKDSFELVPAEKPKLAEALPKACKFQVKDQVIRTTRFTDSFVEGEVHQVERVSDCGQYIWVGGYRGKVPVRYFKHAPVVGVAPPPKEPELPEGGLTTFDTPTTAAPPSADGQDCGRVAGDNPHGCGLVAKTEPKPEPVTAQPVLDKHNAGLIKTYIQQVGNGDIPITEIDHTLVAGVVLSGVPVEYYSTGFRKWLPVNPHTLTIAMIERTSFRAKPEVLDFYGNEIVKPVNPHDVTGRVYGVSLNNAKTYPCSNGTARVNHDKGLGLYWATEEQAEAVLAILMKPFLRGAK